MDMKLVLVPGAACGRASWLCQTQDFSGAEAVLLPGHPDGEPRTSVDDYVDWLHSYLEARDYRDIVLGGHSMGGAVAQLYALKYPARLAALILVATGARLRIKPELLAEVRSMLHDPARWRAFLEGRHSNNVPEAREAIIAERVRIGPAVQLNDLLCCDRFDVMPLVHNIKLPTLIIGGQEDDLAPVKYADYLKAEIKNSKELIVPGVGHWVQAEKPAEVNRAIRDFLADLG